MNTEKLMKDLDRCDNEAQMKKVFEENFEDIAQRKMMWDLLKTLRDKNDKNLTSKDNGNNDFMKNIIDTVTEYDKHSKKK